MSSHDIISALFGAVVGLALQLTGSALMALKQTAGSEFGGTLYAILSPSGGKPERIEEMQVRQRGQRISGSIRRVAPASERGRTWKLEGYVHGNVITALFFPTNPRTDSSSYGIIALHRDATVTDCGVWRGYYIRPDSHGADAVQLARPKRQPLVWQRIDPSTRSYA